MTLLVLIILAAIWAAVLLPPYLQGRSESRPADSISAFRNQLSVLERRAGASTGYRPTSGAGRRTVRADGPTVAAFGRAPVAATHRGAGRPGYDPARVARAEAKKRRRDILFTLVAASAITLVLSLVAAPVLVVHLLIDVLLAGYVALLLRMKRIAEERAMKVRFLRPTPVAYRPELALRRTAT